jgi:GDP-4-dehydro-6-deoxy-D-mannose reductase
VIPSSVLITGAAGFVGGAAVVCARESWPGARVTGADLRGGDVQCDLRDPGAVRALLHETAPDVLLHLAGTTRGADLDELRRGNLEPLEAVLDALAVEAGDCVVVVPGSAAEYGMTQESDGPVGESRPLRPLSPYGLVKAEQTRLALAASARGLRVTVARIFNLCGAGTPERLVLGGVAAQLRRIAAGEQEPIVHTGDLSAVRDFIDVGDACAALVALADAGFSGHVYNVCSGVPTVVGDAVRALIEMSGTGAVLAARPAAPAPGSVPWSVGANDKLRAATGWRPRTSLAESLVATLG